MLRLAFQVLLTAGLGLCFSCGQAAAGTDAYDKVWRAMTLYQNDENRVVRKFALSGRLQGDAAWIDAEQGDFDDTLWRRVRFGFKTDLFQRWVLHVEANWELDDHLDSPYGRLTDAYVGWSRSDDFGLKFLKHSAGFTLDGATSSKRLLTPERNNITNNLWFNAEYFTGFSATGNPSEDWECTAGLFSSDGNEELSHFDAGWFVLLSARRDLAQRLELDTATIRVDYVYNDEHEDADTSDFSQVLSISTQWQRGPWGLWTDLSAGRGFSGQSDLWGVAVMPFHSFTSHLQLVLRYTFISSEDGNGVRLGRYEREVVDGRGDEYREAFGGLNVFFYGHKLKWQTGVQRASMHDEAGDGGAYSGWALTTAARIYW